MLQECHVDNACHSQDIRETAPCSEPEDAVDCEFGPWTPWTTCSESARSVLQQLGAQILKLPIQ
eukprot:3707601-Amphidinium_carterae.2